jgi:hypothetical protein
MFKPRVWMLSIVALFAMTLSTPTFAGKRARKTKPATSKTSKTGKKGSKSTKQASYVPKTQHLTFGDEDVNAGVDGPGGAVVQGDKRTKHSSLIKVRTNFIAELIKSAEDI